MQNPILIQIKTQDGLTLPGLLYEAKSSQKVAIHLHGNGSSSVFYSDDQRDTLARTLIKEGISLLLFNNRGAHYIKKLNVEKNSTVEQKLFGMAYEKIKECVQDVDGAINLLESKRYKEFYLIGESTGANKTCVYNFYKPQNKVSKYVLLGGGDDTGICYGQLGKDKFYALLKQAKERTKKHKAEDIICELLPDEIFSYQGFYDVANPNGDYNVFPFLEVIRKIKLSKKPLFRHFKSMKKPTLVIYGEKDKWAWNIPKMIEILKEIKPEFTYKVIKNADHSFSEHQKQLATLISDWLRNSF